MIKDKLSNIDIHHTCRYNWILLKDTTIKEVLINNEWIFNDSWSMFSFNNEAQYERYYGREAFFSGGLNGDGIIEKHRIQLHSSIHEFHQWIDYIDWDLHGTWYVNNFPVKHQKIRVKTVGRKKQLTIKNEIDINGKNSLLDYYSLSPEWQYIHDLGSDIF